MTNSQQTDLAIAELTALLQYLEDTYRPGTLGELAVRTLKQHIRGRRAALKDMAIAKPLPLFGDRE